MAHADRTSPANHADTDQADRHLQVVLDPDEERRRQLAEGIDQLRRIRAQLPKARGRDA